MPISTSLRVKNLFTDYYRCAYKMLKTNSIFGVEVYTQIHLFHNQHEIILKVNSYSNKPELVMQICRINQFIYTHPVAQHITTIPTF